MFENRQEQKDTEKNTFTSFAFTYVYNFLVLVNNAEFCHLILPASMKNIIHEDHKSTENDQINPKNAAQDSLRKHAHTIYNFQL